jgi:protein-S-isoprenylcysteine O-methyltransferase Ste14
MVTSPSPRHIFLKSLLHNVGAFIVSLVVAGLGLVLGAFFNIHSFLSLYSIVAGLPLLVVGFWLRMWASICFYERGLKIISTTPQNTLITAGPYRFTRNPLYLGGNVFMVFGSSLLLGSTVDF